MNVRKCSSIMMKKVILLLFVLIGTSSYAQNLKVGAMAGLDVSSPSHYDSKVGFNAGLKGELGLPDVAEGLYLDFGVLISSKGWKSSKYYDNTTKESSQWESNPYYLNVPVRIGYKFALGEKTSIFVNAGPYIGIGLFGKQKVTMETDTGKKTTKTVADNVFSDKQAERFDWGIGGKVGFEFMRHYQLSAGYDWGLKNINKAPNAINSKNRTFSLSFAYLF